MPIPKIEVPTGLINGVNTLYTLSRPYTAGTVVGIWRGLPRAPADDDGLLETSPSLGTVTMKQAPETGDVLQFFYLDTTADTATTTVLKELSGEIETTNELSGEITTTNALVGEID